MNCIKSLRLLFLKKYIFAILVQMYNYVARYEMKELHKGIILRTSSAYKSAITLLDEQHGKIEGLVYKSKPTGQLFHGALITYSLKKSHHKYVLSDIQLLDMPSYWVHEHFLFFHHVLELSDFFLPWDQQASGLFGLLHLLYTDPALLGTKRSQKLFLCHLFKRLGMYPEEGLMTHTEKRTEKIERWLRACISVHPQAGSLQTIGFLKTLELHEEAV